VTELRTAGADPVARAGLPSRCYAWVDARGPRIAAGAAALYAVLGLAYAVLLGDRIRYYDEEVYVGLADRLVAGQGYTLDGVNATAYRPPGYPFLLAAVDALGGGIVVMRLLGVAALAGSVLLAYRLGERVHSRAAGAVAAVLIAFLPLLVFTAGTLYPQVPALFLLLLVTWLALRAVELPAGWPRQLVATGAGLAAGLLILAVPTFGPSVLAVAVWLLCARSTRAAARRVVPVLLIATAVLPGAWCVRNAVQLDAFVPVSTNNGINLILGNSEGVSAGGGRVGDIARYEREAATLGLSEVEQDGFYRDAAVSWIRQHPGEAAALYAGKVLNNFNFRNELATAGQNNTLQDAISAITYYPLLALFALRVALLRRWRLTGLEKLLAGLVLGNVLLLAVFYTRLRFRVPLDGLMLISSAAMLAELIRRRAGPVDRGTAAAAAGTGAPAATGATG
jgi:4-amino-4-deoxy-L-arabinose transferase-like glycosyltransferase